MTHHDSRTSWKQKRGKQALRDWRTWVFVIWVAVVVQVCPAVRNGHGWIPALVLFAILLVVELVVIRIWK